MENNYSNVELIINKDLNHFELEVDGLTAFIDYRQTKEDLLLIHTEVPEELEGRGVAKALVEKTLVYAEKNGLKIIPRCTYVASYIKKHPEWNRIVKAEDNDWTVFRRR